MSKHSPRSDHLVPCRIARQWLAHLPGRRRGGGAPALDLISDDDDSSDDSIVSRNARNPPARVSDASQRILRGWLDMIR